MYSIHWKEVSEAFSEMEMLLYQIVRLARVEKVRRDGVVSPTPSSAIRVIFESLIEERMVLNLQKDTPLGSNPI